MKSVAVVLFTFLTLSAHARFAAADQIQITGGTLEVIGSLEGSVSIEGERGFTLYADVSALDGSFAPWRQCTACSPGANISLNGIFVDTSLRNAVVTLDGVTYTNVDSLTTPSAAAIFFTGGPVVAPPAGQELVTLVGPFLFTGLFNTGTERVDLVGQGTAAVTLRPFPGVPAWLFTSAVYSFENAAPIPEPATMLLVAGGLGVILRRRRKKDRH